MFYQNHSLALRSYSGDILKFNFKKSLDLDLEILDWLTGLGLTLWSTGTGLKKYLNYLAGLGFVLYYIRVRLEKYLDYIGFELVLWYVGLGLNTWTWIKLLDSDWFYYNEPGMLLEMSENLLELSVKHLVIQSRLASSDDVGVWKTKCKCCF